MGVISIGQPTVPVSGLATAAPTPLVRLLGTDESGVAANYLVGALDQMRGVELPQSHVPAAIAATGTNIADGLSHPLSDFYATLPAAQVDFPHALALTDELAWACVQAAVAAAALQSTYGYELSAAVLLPPGDYRINRTIRLWQVRGLHLAGISRGTRLFWYGPTTDPVIDLPDSRDCYLGNLQVRCVTAATCVVRMWNTSAGATIPTANAIERLLVDFVGATVVDCIRIGDGAGEPTNVDANNEFHTIRDCVLTGYSDSAVKIDGSQAYNIMLDNCQLSGNASGGQHGVYCNYGSFMLRGGGGGSNSVADFVLINQNSQPIGIDGFCSEHSGRLFYAPNYSTALKMVTIDRVRWSSADEHVTGRIIEVNCQMALTIRNTRLNDLNHQGRAGGQQPNYLYFAGGFLATKDTSQLVLEDVYLGTSAHGGGVSPFLGAGPTAYQGVRIYTTNPATLVPLSIYPEQLTGATPSIWRSRRGGDQNARFANASATTVTDLLNCEPGTLIAIMGDGNTSLSYPKFTAKPGRPGPPYLIPAGETILLVYDVINTTFREVGS